MHSPPLTVPCLQPHVPQATQLQQRVWLIHWSLFIFFNTEGGRSQMIEFLFNER